MATNLKACVHPVRIAVTKEGVEAELLIHGPDAGELAADMAGRVLEEGGETEIFDLAEQAKGPSTFSGVGEGKWEAIRNDPSARNGRLKVVHQRRSTPDLIQ